MSKGFLLGKHLHFSLILALLGPNDATAAIAGEAIDDATKVTIVKKSSKEILPSKIVKKRNWRKIALITAGVVTVIVAVSLYYVKANPFVKTSQKNSKVKYAGVIPVKKGHCFAGNKTFETLDSVLLYKGPMLHESFTSDSSKLRLKDFCQLIPEGMTPEAAAAEALNNIIPGIFDVKPEQLEFIAYYPMEGKNLALNNENTRDHFCAGYIVNIPDLEGKIAEISKTNRTNKINKTNKISKTNKTNTLANFNQTDQSDYLRFSINPKEIHSSSITDIYLKDTQTICVDHHYRNNVLTPLYNRYVFPFLK